MHNLHFCVVNASSPKELSKLKVKSLNGELKIIGEPLVVVSVRITKCIPRMTKDKEWGNWRWCPEEGTTVEDINRQIRGWIKEDEYEKDLFIKCSEGKHKSPFDWYGPRNTVRICFKSK